MNVEKTFAEALDSVQPIRVNSNDQDNELHVCNLVAKVKLLYKDESLSLVDVVGFAGGMGKLQPDQFKAAVIRIKDTIAQTTSLVFRRGNLVTLGAVTVEHARLACQTYRLYIESIPIRYQYGGRFVQTTLSSRTVFSQWRITNMVSHFSLNVRPNLISLLSVASGDANYEPGNFPGLNFLVWVHPKSKCKCDAQKRKRKGSCACNVKALIFDTGNVVITGGSCLREINLAKHRLLALLEDETFQDHEAQVPRNERFQQRRKKFLENDFVDFLGIETKNEKKQKRAIVQNPTAAEVVVIAHPLIGAAKLGNLQLVRQLLQGANPSLDDVSMALNQIVSIPEENRTDEHDDIINILYKVFEDAPQ